MFIRSSVLAPLLLLSLVLTGKSEIMHDGAQTDAAWRQEYIDLGKKYDSVVALYGYDGSSWKNIGSATVITPYNAIGAAHVALSNGGQKYQNYAMVTGSDLVNDVWGTYYTTKVSVIPEFTQVITSPDMAIWTFDQPIARVTPATLYRGSDSALLQSLGELAGFGKYGYASTGVIGMDGAKRGIRDRLYELGDTAYGAPSDQLIFSFDLPNSPFYQRLGGCLADLDSGGGWFMNGQLVGVNDFRLGGYNYGATGATSISQHIGWIDSHVVPEPSTLAMLGSLAGVVVLYRLRRRKVV